MVQLKIILDTRRKKADGSYPILFRTTNYKQVNYLSFGVSISDLHWDENSRSLTRQHPNAQTINASLVKRVYEIQKTIKVSSTHYREKLGKVIHICYICEDIRSPK